MLRFVLKHKILALVVGSIVAICGGLFLSVLIVMFIIWAFGSSGEFLMIPPQDCYLDQLTLHGQVVTADSEAVSNARIEYQNLPVDSSTPVKDVIFTSSDGRFGPRTLSFYKCETITFTISADGFQPQSRSYILDQGLLNSLPQYLDIILERTS